MYYLYVYIVTLGKVMASVLFVGVFVVVVVGIGGGGGSGGGGGRPKAWSLRTLGLLEQEPSHPSEHHNQT